MYVYGAMSLTRLRECHSHLQVIFYEALELGLIDIAIVCAHRNEEDQMEAFNNGRSKVRWPNSKHNVYPSLAIDAVPYVNGQLSYNFNHCCFLAGIVLGIAKAHPVTIRWGGNWDMDGEPITDQEFQDLAHYEVVL